MTRKKVKLAFIVNETARKATYKKRKRGLLKKINELATLCGVEACAIVYNPYDYDPEVWPSPFGVQQVLNKFKRMPEMDQSKKMVNQESFLHQRIGKVSDQVKKQRKENREKEITQVMFQGLVGRSMLSLNMMDLSDLGWIIDDYFKEVLKRQENLLKGNPNPDMNNVTKKIANNSQDGAADLDVAAPAVLEDGIVVEVPTLREVAPLVVSQAAAPPPEAALGRPPGFELSYKQQWFVDMLNTQDQIHFGGGPIGGVDEMLPPFSDQNQSGFNWPNGYFH